MYRTIIIIIMGFVLTIVSGCRSVRNGSNVPQIRRFETSASTQPKAKKAAEPLEINPPTGSVTFPEAMAYALIHNPDLKAFSFELRAAEARALQAGLPPNPHLHAEVEEFGGAGERSGFDSAETAIELDQLIELGGKRDKRIHLASLDEERTRWDYESVRLDVMLEVARAYVAVLAAQERVVLSRKMLDVARKAQSAVAQRVEAGKDPPVEELRANVALSKSEIEAKKTTNALATAWRKLAAAIGSQTVNFDEATGEFYTTLPAPSIDDLAKAIAGSPDLERWAAEERKRRAAVDMEKAKATSDVTVSGGVRYFEEGDDAAFVIGVALPIPLFNRNQGSIEEAMENLAKAREQYKAAKIKRTAALDAALNELAGVYEEVAALQSYVLANSERAFETAYQGYEEGKFDYLYVLDTQRTLFETRAQYIDAVETYHQTRARVDRLMGRGIDTIKQEHKQTGGPIQ
jgi:cobalt-zinc-cadmium efflux system outer membrane protein